MIGNARHAALGLSLAVAGCEAFQVPSNSMAPTILAGDYVYVAHSFDSPHRQEIVAYHWHGLPYMKRVVGLPGDTLSMRAGVLFVNGTALNEPYASHATEKLTFDPAFQWQRGFLLHAVDSAVYHPTLTYWGPIVLPADSYFILGDNRGESADSRYTGPVNGEDIFARAVVIYFSQDRVTGAIRWNRIGMEIR